MDRWMDGCGGLGGGWLAGWIDGWSNSIGPPVCHLAEVTVSCVRRILSFTGWGTWRERRRGKQGGGKEGGIG